jgi:hypothetical protein
MMPRLSTPVAVLITVVLALLLIFYVFSGDGGGSRSDAGARCSSREIHEQIKAELFRRAAVVRGGNDPAFAQVGAYSVLRTAAPAVRREAGASRASCAASIVLDLPPGVEAIGGRRSLAAKVGYSVVAGEQGRSRLGELGKADAIVLPLATIGRTGSQQEELAPPAAATDPAAPPTDIPPTSTEPPPAREPITAAPEQARRNPAPPPEPRSTATATVRPRRPTVAEPSRPRSTAPSRQTAQPQAGPVTAPAPAPVAAVRPSFDCRKARTRGEIAVCNDPALASLDRQMSSQFYRALSTASPGARLMLQRTRTRFLAYRDSCGSSACIAAAYSARMREISEITSGRF